MYCQGPTLVIECGRIKMLNAHLTFNTCTLFLLRLRFCSKVRTLEKEKTHTGAQTHFLSCLTTNSWQFKYKALIRKADDNTAELSRFYS